MIPIWRNAESSVRVVRINGSKEVDALIRLFEGVAEEEGWQPHGALRRNRRRSVYFALEVRGQLVGGLQLVLPDRQGTLPCHTLWPETPLGPSNRVAHVAILTLEKAVRAQGILFWHLVIEMWRYCVGEGITTLFIEVTPRVLPLYRRLGWPLAIQGELLRHWGEDCHLCTLGIPEVAEALLRRAECSSYYRRIVAQAFRVTISEKVRKRSGAGSEETVPAAA